MSGEERRKKVLEVLGESSGPVSAGNLAKRYNVSRQVIVQDIALLRASGYKILSTSRGYVTKKERAVRRVFKVRHTPEQAQEELTMIVDCGGKVLDVFIYHRVYGIVRGELNIASRLDVQKYVEDISSGKSTPLSSATSGYHYHTVEAGSEAQLDLIQKKLTEMGFLAKLQDYEPVNFWEEGKYR